MAVLAFVITLSVLASSTAARARRDAAQARGATRERRRSPLTAEELALGSEDFILPRLEPPAARDALHALPAPSHRWSAELAAKYWVSPRDIAAEIVQSMNDQNMQRLFQDVP